MKIKKLPRILPSLVVKINKFKLKDKLYGRDIIWRFNMSNKSGKGGPWNWCNKEIGVK